MSYQALARKYRPQTFRDIIGQETVVRTLRNAIEQNRIHHAYLFSGVRGVGKTTAARILAKALNCQHGPTADPCNKCTICREITEGIDLDVREIDAATYTQVENIRELREVSQFQPARDRKRIFIIDEAHMLSGASWNALLKLIEEPPPHVTFMFATTEMQKVPATILSRVQSFVFRKITQAELAQRLAEICESEGIAADKTALEIVARRGEGSVRDSLSLLDQIIAFSGRSLTAADVSTILGLSNAASFARILRSIRDGDHASVLEALEETAQSGRDFKLLFRDLLSFGRDLLLLVSGASESLVSADPTDLVALRELSSEFDYSSLLRILNLLMKDDDTVSKAEHQRLAVEIALLKAATFPRLRAIEDALRGETSAPRQAQQTAPSRPAPRPASDERPQSAPARASAPPPAAATGGGGALEDLVARVRSQRRLTATYIEQARGSRWDGDTLILEFDPANQFAVDFMDADQLRFLGEIASQLRGRPATVRVSTGAAATAEPKERPKSPLSEDPVVRSFAAHLGGEVIPPRGRK